jgi:hypothetical protein
MACEVSETICRQRRSREFTHPVSPVDTWIGTAGYKLIVHLLAHPGLRLFISNGITAM